MFGRDWSYHVALGWIAPSAILAGFALAHLISGGDLLYCKDTNAGSSKTAQEQKPISAVEPLQSEKSCREQSSQRDDKCQSWRQAEAAEDQACVARRQFYVATFIGLFGLIGLLATVIFTAQSAKATRDTLVAGNRAWIRRDRITFSVPLEFRDDGLLSSAVRFEFTNVGNAPAIHINIFAWFLPVTGGLVPVDAAKERFDRVRNNPVSSGFSLFPDQAYPRANDIPVNQSVWLSATETAAVTDNAGRIPSLYLAACINYSFASDPTKNHQTTCLFEVRVPGFITRGRGEIPEGQVRLLEFPGFGGMDLAD